MNREDELQELGNDAELHVFGQVGRPTCSEKNIYEYGESHEWEKEKFEEGVQISRRCGDGDVYDAGEEKRRRGGHGRARGSRKGERPPEEVNTWRHDDDDDDDDDQLHRGEAPVEDASDTCVERG